jgi:hypothetical protein
MMKKILALSFLICVVAHAQLSTSGPSGASAAAPPIATGFRHVTNGTEDAVNASASSLAEDTVNVNGVACTWASDSVEEWARETSGGPLTVTPNSGNVVIWFHTGIDLYVQWFNPTTGQPISPLGHVLNYPTNDPGTEPSGHFVYNGVSGRAMGWASTYPTANSSAGTAFTGSNTPLSLGTPSGSASPKPSIDTNRRQLKDPTGRVLVDFRADGVNAALSTYTFDPSTGYLIGHGERLSFGSFDPTKVSTVGPGDGNVLKWNSDDGKFEPSSPDAINPFNQSLNTGDVPNFAGLQIGGANLSDYIANLSFTANSANGLYGQSGSQPGSIDDVETDADSATIAAKVNEILAALRASGAIGQ